MLTSANKYVQIPANISKTSEILPNIRKCKQIVANIATLGKTCVTEYKGTWHTKKLMRNHRIVAIQPLFFFQAAPNGRYKEIRPA